MARAITVGLYPLQKKLNFKAIYISGVVLWFYPFVIYKAVGLPTWLDQTPNMHRILTKGIGLATEVNARFKIVIHAGCFKTTTACMYILLLKLFNANATASMLSKCLLGERFS